jgi:hypothetical protein
VAPRIDYSALLYPVKREDVEQFRAQARLASTRWSRYSASQLPTILMAIVIGTAALGIIGFGFIGFMRSPAQTGGDVGIFIVPVLIVGATIALVIFGARYLNNTLGSNNWERWLRATRFAEANGLVFSPYDVNPNYPGMIFNHGSSRTVRNHYRSASGRFLDIGTMSYVVRRGKNSSTYRWGFMALSLDRALPNMVLDARSNNTFLGMSNLPELFRKDQVLHLEGDFNKHFTLYCPRQYERDALYVFTPDLMALLIDEAAPFDVEIVDTWMFVYSATPVNPVDPKVLDRYFRIIDTVGSKTLSQTARYADERIGDPAVNLVAPQGQRLRGRAPIIAIVVIALWLASFFVPQFLTMLR